MTRLEMLWWGEGDTTAVLIHGLSAQAALWSATAQNLAPAGYRVIAPDLRGHGRSPRGPYSVDHWVEDVLENVPPDTDLAIGHSLGAVVLLQAASRLRPKRAVYIDPPWVAPADPEAAIADFEARKLLTREAIRAANPLWTEEEIDLRREGFELWDPGSARDFMNSRERDYTPSSPPPRPSLVVLPEPSPLAPRETVDALRANGWTTTQFPGTGHYVHLDEREAFWKELRGWLQGTA